MGSIFYFWRRCLASVRRCMEIVFGRRFLSTLAVPSASVTRLAHVTFFRQLFFARGCKRVGFVAVVRRKHVMCYSVSAWFVFYCHRQEAKCAGQRSAATGQPRRSPQRAHWEAPGGPRRLQGDQGRPRGRGLVGTPWKRVRAPIHETRQKSPADSRTRLILKRNWFQILLKLNESASPRGLFVLFRALGPGLVSNESRRARVLEPPASGGCQKCGTVVESGFRGVRNAKLSSNLGSGVSKVWNRSQIWVPGRQKCEAVVKSGLRGVKNVKRRKASGANLPLTKRIESPCDLT